MTGTLLILIRFYLFVIGAVFGSFGTLVGDRVPAKRSIVSPGSSCSECGRSLQIYELIPMLSWLILGGRCRQCRAIIPFRYPVWELVLGIAVVLSFWHSSSVTQAIATCLLWFMLTVATATDVTSLLIPNWLTYAGAIILFALGVVWMHAWAAPLVGMAIGFGMILLVHLASGGKMGLGDAKLFLGIGACLGGVHVVEAFIFACLYGALIGSSLRFFGFIQRGQFVPFVPFITAGVATTQFLLPSLPNWYVHVLLHI